MASLSHALLFLAILVGMVLVFVSLENVYWSKRDKQKIYKPLEVIVNFSLGASYKLADAVAISLYVFLLYDLIKPYGLNIDFGINPATLLLLYVIVDLGFYMAHWAMHKVRFLWVGHVTHHSSERYNFSTALRQNFLVSINGALLIWWIPLALFGFDKELVLLAMELNLLYQFFLHTEIPTPRWNKFGWILNTPSLHRIHHGCNPEQIDRNFGGTFIIWDKLFGTFAAENNVGELRYGITRNQPKSWNPLVLLFAEPIDLIKDLIRTKDPRVLYKPPGWIDMENDQADTNAGVSEKNSGKAGVQPQSAYPLSNKQ